MRFMAYFMAAFFLLLLALSGFLAVAAPFLQHRDVRRLAKEIQRRQAMRAVIHFDADRRF